MPKKAQKEGISQKDICFVISPFGEWFDIYYKEIFKPAIIDAGLEPHRIDDLYAPNIIVSDIWEYTQKASIVLAVLTGKNPNVFYELGLAHALPRPVILITESMDDVPFDLKPIRIIPYDRNKPDWGQILREGIISSIKEIIKDPKKAIPATFLKSIQGPEVPVVTAREKDILSIRQEIDSLRREIIRTSPGREIISPVEAEAIIKDYIIRGMPEEMIIARVHRRGPPVSWIRTRIEKIKQLGSSTLT